MTQLTSMTHTYGPMKNKKLKVHILTFVTVKCSLGKIIKLNWSLLF